MGKCTFCLNIDKTLEYKRQNEMNLRGYRAQWFPTQALCQNHTGSFKKIQIPEPGLLSSPPSDSDSVLVLAAYSQLWGSRILVAFLISLTIDLGTRKVRGRVTSLKSHRNISPVKIDVHNVKLIPLAIF